MIVAPIHRKEVAKCMLEAGAIDLIFKYII